MKPRLAIIFFFIILMPLGLLIFLGHRVARYEQESVQLKFDELLDNQLTAVDTTILNFIDQRQRELLNVVSTLSCDPITLRSTIRDQVFISQLFCLNQDGDVLYPSPLSELNEAEWDFLDRTKDILIGKNLVSHMDTITDNPPIQQDFTQSRQQGGYSPQTNNDLNQSIQSQQALSEQQMTTKYGWFAWYWGTGINLIFWFRSPDHRIVGAEVDRIRLLADVIGILPETNVLTSLPLQGRITLSNALGQTLYQWGSYEPASNDEPVVEKYVSYPLRTWKLSFYIPPDQLTAVRGHSVQLSLTIGLIALGSALFGLAFYFYREHSREMREAARRVSFVNQVSHELKTPLTNIRMYAELLEERLVDDDEKVLRHLNIIVSESQRLSRLIGNILTFSRTQREKLSLRFSSDVIDDTIHSVLGHFKASFEQLNITVSFEAKACQIVQFDRDAVAQILGNLFSNVEKYAARGESLSIKSFHEQSQTVVIVSDQGPGIPVREKERIFIPFMRLSNKLTDGVSGTGIGLSIARELARLHGGDLVLLPTAQGASFELRINTPASDKGDIV
ncbi:sensor histidine kinase [candidate division CSSED10-310 bacterium]|uniref:histidine kinase n=1 Tax=candidate division CSSED10-310 bacterium TaxID=2855610 RepID=A0ABV6Z4Y5_UNCC1